MKNDLNLDLDLKQNTNICHAKFGDLEANGRPVNIRRRKCHFGIADPDLPTGIHYAPFMRLQ